MFFSILLNLPPRCKRRNINEIIMSVSDNHLCNKTFLSNTYNYHIRKVPRPKVKNPFTCCLLLNFLLVASSYCRSCIFPFFFILFLLFPFCTRQKKKLFCNNVLTLSKYLNRQSTFICIFLLETKKNNNTQYLK